ncbi:MAG TPA: nucleoside hydrolase [Candidatus Latescibacteria bacterium]|nr:nucleoside hydrolase [Candidatus Latescibacterota bacterium]
MRVILDCDTKNEIDDQFAITYAFAKDVRIEAIVNVQNTHANGPESVTIYQEETAAILAALGRPEVPNLRGVERPLDNNLSPGSAEGVDFIIDRALTEDPEPLFVIGTGPATDLASALLRAPEIASKARFIWLGGFRDEEEFRRRGSEWNALGDPWAVKALFESRAAMLSTLFHVPAWGVTEKLVWRTEWLVGQLREMAKPIHTLLADRTVEWTTRSGRSLSDNPPKEFWDIGAVDVAIHPERHSLRFMPAHGLGENAEWVIPASGTHVIGIDVDLEADAILSDALCAFAGL